jgi:hypothetical protein
VDRSPRLVPVEQVDPSMDAARRATAWSVGAPVMLKLDLVSGTVLRLVNGTHARMLSVVFELVRLQVI